LTLRTVVIETCSDLFLGYNSIDHFLKKEFRVHGVQQDWIYEHRKGSSVVQQSRPHGETGPDVPDIGAQEAAIQARESE
jgi:hypothetical protein